MLGRPRIYSRRERQPRGTAVKINFAFLFECFFPPYGAVLSTSHVRNPSSHLKHLITLLLKVVLVCIAQGYEAQGRSRVESQYRENDLFPIIIKSPGCLFHIAGWSFRGALKLSYGLFASFEGLRGISRVDVSNSTAELGYFCRSCSTFDKTGFSKTRLHQFKSPFRGKDRSSKRGGVEVP